MYTGKSSELNQRANKCIIQRDMFITREAHCQCSRARIQSCPEVQATKDLLSTGSSIYIAGNSIQFNQLRAFWFQEVWKACGRGTFGFGNPTRASFHLFWIFSRWMVLCCAQKQKSGGTCQGSWASLPA